MGFALFDLDLRFVEVSAATAAVLRKPPEAIRGARLADLCPVLAAGIEPRVREVLENGAPQLGVTSETELPDGVVRSAVGHFYPVRDGQQALAGVVSLWWETTEQRAARVAEEEYEARWRAMADGAPVLVWMSGAGKGRDWFNRPWLVFRGRAAGEEAGFGWVRGVHPDDRDRCLSAYGTAVDLREPYEVEFRLARHDAAWRWVLERGVPRFDGDGAFVGFIGSCVDIDDLKAAERARVEALDAERHARAETERVASRLARLQAVTAAFARAHTMEEVYDTVVEEAVSAAGADAGVVCLYDEERGVIELARAVGYPPEHTEPFRRFGDHEDVPIAEAVRTGRPLYLERVGELTSAYETFRRLATDSGRESVAALPMTVDNRCIGALGLSFCTSQAFDAPQRAFLGAVVAQAGAALHRTRLWEAERAARRELERAHERLVFLAQATAVTASTLDRAEILRRACRLAVQRIADLAVAYMHEGGELRRVALAHGDAGRDHELQGIVNRWPYTLDADVPVSRSWRSRRLLRFDALGSEQLAGAPPTVREAIGGLGLGPSVYVPIVARDQALGVLALAYEAARHAAYSDDDLTVATELASRVASALDNAALYAREHAVAVQLQRAVLPQQLPRDERLHIAARYRPSSSGAMVGGDWYDAFRLRDGRLGLAVGDVAGHGVLAAATMGQLRNALRAYASEGAAPGLVLERLSYLVADDGDAVFATATYGVYDPADHRLRWANAGHVPALLWTTGGARFLEEPADPILGVEPGRGYATAEATLESGDVVLWYTDGLVERRREHLSNGLGRLEAALTGSGSRGVEDVCDSVLRAMIGEGSHGDDICVLAISPA